MADLSKLPQPAAPCLPAGVTDQHGKDAFVVRFGTATTEAVATGSVSQSANTDLAKFPDGLGTYTKGLKQDSAGLPDPATFDQFLKACGIKPGGPVGDFGHPNIVLGGQAKLNGPRGAFALQLIGKDSRGIGSLVVPAAPALDSTEYAIELVELYWASLLRDVPFTQYATNATAQAAALELSDLVAAFPGKYAGPLDGGNVTPGVLFRGGFNAHPKYFGGETVGPYISQLCLLPTSIGRVPLDQKIKTFVGGKDFMTSTTDWKNIQSGILPSQVLSFDDHPRYVRNGRDTAAYTQVDELYQAYFIAYLVCSTLGIGPNPTNPYTTTYKKNEKPFGTFGGPDVTATLGAVARAALNAVWYQKWAVHLRHRPESGGGIVQLLKDNVLNSTDKAKLTNFDIVLKSAALNLSAVRNGNYLLSQAFPEGSPTHPAYPTGHGTVAGACITVLKFFLDGDAGIVHPVVPSPDGSYLEPYVGPGTLTINGELHKLAHNISFGHGIHAGIHWRSDTDYSLLLGEAIAISFLEDQMWTYQERFDVTITKMNGSKHHFKNH
ncbi:phosphoesterase [Bradyrhizobium sp. CSA207]|uniref:vanadium-dependent haloperoxidase n=1 Tax=Bradyrhizobium sp. CSA207 TaxID=2698826 RepID=UPI0023AF8A9B|nr:vanadium-dependent haloperoxidase [Bradyrhizobium sp. CSA207]MDE5445867.1 phosphoesterase [Bradyrhizobium sp. CSA207]